MWSLSQHINLLIANSVALFVSHWPSSSTLPYASSNSNQFMSSQPTYLLCIHYIPVLVVGTGDKRQRVSSLKELVIWWFETVNVTTFNRQDRRRKAVLNKTDSIKPPSKENIFATIELNCSLKGQRWKKLLHHQQQQSKWHKPRTTQGSTHWVHNWQIALFGCKH